MIEPYVRTAPPEAVSDAVAASLGGAAPVFSAVAAGASAVAALAAYRINRSAAQRELFELARSLHEDLTTGAVQDARDTLGSVVHSRAPLDEQTVPNCMAAYFRILWCFERIQAGRTVIQQSTDGDLLDRFVARAGRNLARPPGRLGPTALTFLDELISWHVGEWAANFGQRKATGGGQLRSRLDATAPDGLHDEKSFAAFEQLAVDLGYFPASTI